MIYLDSSALMKMVRSESESAALDEWLQARPDERLITSELGRVEVLRNARRVSPMALAAARAILADLDLVPLARAVLDIAADVEDPRLRTLDALHLASAIAVGSILTAFVVYDHRLADAARTTGLAVAAPGQ